MEIKIIYIGEWILEIWREFKLVDLTWVFGAQPLKTNIDGLRVYS